MFLAGSVLSRFTVNKELFLKPYNGKFSSILLFGPPGAGKRTLGKFLSDAGCQYHLSSGEIFRSLPTGSAAGKLYYSYASKGQLLPDEVTIEIWKCYVQGLIATNSYYPENQDLLLDGIPRTLEQAKMLQDYISIRHIIVLEVSDNEKLMNRLQKRAIKEGHVDDHLVESLEKRMKNYKRETEDILGFYPNHLISKVNAEQKPLEVLRDVLVRLSHLLCRRQ